MSRSLNRRTLATMVVFLTSIVILVTSVLMFINRYSNQVATVHIVVGFLFLAFAHWHALNNIAALKLYLNPKNLLKLSSKHGLATFVAVGFSVGIVVLAVVEFEPFKRFHQWGTIMRLSGEVEASEGEVISYRIVDYGSQHTGRELKVDFKMGQAFHWPQYAIWIESLDGSFIQPLFVTESVATNTFKNKVWLSDSATVLNSNPFDKKEFEFESLFSEDYNENASNNKFRVESLPVFLHKFNKTDSAVGTEGDTEGDTNGIPLDGYTGATLFDNYILSQKIKNTAIQQFNVFFEINQSFDFNEYYSSDRFPHDKVYSGDGFSAQPSVIYHAQIDFNSPTTLYPMSLAGHGHHSGQNGEIHPEVGKLTTALKLVDRILIDVR
ncbi:hypothetical protein [Teredinibacter purpureus]|uniref:hypothetical protein n=1 Tax=Teredinibacter purpureus TaxID=2731756 RepID=UPI0005F82361|nr:hypothetical protein [Teredinibacter purpureus]